MLHEQVCAELQSGSAVLRRATMQQCNNTYMAARQLNALLCNCAFVQRHDNFSTVLRRKWPRRLSAHTQGFRPRLAMTPAMSYVYAMCHLTLQPRRPAASCGCADCHGLPMLHATSHMAAPLVLRASRGCTSHGACCTSHAARCVLNVCAAFSAPRRNPLAAVPDAGPHRLRAAAVSRRPSIRNRRRRLRCGRRRCGRRAAVRGGLQLGS